MQGEELEHHEDKDKEEEAINLKEIMLQIME